jgi:Kef-type K+ transport system membrane component KefB
MLLSVLLALTVIIVTARLTGLLFKKLHQPAVIGEVIGGILLGPSLFGRLAPDLYALWLPAATAPALGVVAQAGVLIYMFVIGVGLDRSVVKSTIRATLPIALASIAVPFICGAGLAILLFDSLAPAGVPLLTFQLFLGVSLSIVAFPVLARILSDRGMQRTRLGVMAITCAAINDTLGWGVLALVVTVMQASPAGGFLGTHAILIAFVIGVVTPRGFIPSRAIDLVSRFASVLLMPAFFAIIGLRTEIGLVSTAMDWLICTGIIIVATAGQFGGTTLASRASGLEWRDSAALGILMNTRGLVELIVLKIGLDAGVITPRLFTMLVIMALVTTMMTSPILTRLTRTV